MQYFDLGTIDKIQNYRQKQLNNGIFKQLVYSIDEIQTLPQSIREKIKSKLSFPSLRQVKEAQSQDKSALKVLLECLDGKQIESVLLSHEDGRKTVCISTQIGCPMGCKFCATGQMGFTRNLTHQEIVDQVLHFARLLAKTEKRISNIVFMGMGEPLLNLNNVISATEILTDAEQFGIGSRRITLSTVGLIKPMREYFKKFPQVNLAISLHSANQKKRKLLMPKASTTSIDDLIKYIKYHIQKYNRRITLEYSLIENFNDSPSDAKEIENLIYSVSPDAAKLIHINLIPYNEINGIKFKASPRHRVNEFRRVLAELGINATVRKSLGQDKKAACGMLKTTSKKHK
ncbi:23S rRNA (adenine(2503)-C(2))-methyltransferase RlmN [Candidatus Dojkabacteria bacterium]|nr:23S rRNA (adenine(2503)-C(2))-methyltransferase RlmN [Candidatus Dojkabacteria bacterium]